MNTSMLLTIRKSQLVENKNMNFCFFTLNIFAFLVLLI